MESKMGYVHAEGTSLHDGDGKKLVLKGVNLGDWFVQEFWMASSCVDGFQTGIYTQSRGIAAMRDNPNLQEGQIRELEAFYIDTFIQEADFKRIRDLGLNVVRINFSVYNLTDNGENVREKGFEKLDWAVDMAKKHGLYVILDLHGAIGSQNMDHHSGDDAHFNLFGSPENRRKTVHLWEQIAEHFKESRTVAGYDLLNESRRKKHRYGGKVCFDFYDELYRAVRKIDPNHMIIVECFSFPNHGADSRGYGWKNVCYEYHIYNLTPLSQMTCLRFYRFLHEKMGYEAPVYIGEWNAWGRDKDWQRTFDFFDRLGWSYTSWTYKVNRYPADHGVRAGRGSWGLLEIDVKPVNLHTATYEEIKKTYLSVGSENAKETHVYDSYKKRFLNKIN
ncbi:MAG TPA: cellulase family glycosylhydrolase [Candidatus Enterosoma merdigallinarum]|nr:cellulase family glycosylhydrolase [Candidatus Enterosoma merdigallinarum]